MTVIQLFGIVVVYKILYFIYSSKKYELLLKSEYTEECQCRAKAQSEKERLTKSQCNAGKVQGPQHTNILPSAPFLRNG